jgi:hypothetical protein
MFERCPSLDKFIISNSCISDSSLKVLAASCRCLSTLYLSTCWKITDEGVMALCDSAPPLKILDLGRSQAGAEAQNIWP